MESHPSEIKKRNFWCKDEEFLEYSRKSYSSYMAGIPSHGDGTLIPKHLHFIWIGSELPPRFAEMIQQWRCMHPDWGLTIWDDSKVATLELRNQRAYKRASNYAMMSDILRYEILEREGGVYVDVDYECIAPLDTIVQSCSFFLGLSNCDVVEVNNGFVGCSPGHPLIKHIVESIDTGTAPESLLASPLFSLSAESGNQLAVLQRISDFLGPIPPSDPVHNGSVVPIFCERSVKEVTGQDRGAADAAYFCTIAETGPGHVTKCIAQYIADAVAQDKHFPDQSDTVNSVVIFPVDYFHAVPNSVRVDIQDISGRNHLKELHTTANTIAVHWWQRSWQQNK